MADSPGPETGGPADLPPSEEVADGIANELLNIHRQSYGAGAAKVVSHLIDDTLVVLLDGLELQPGERFLIENGHAEVVARMRHDYQAAIEPTFRAAVERATGRRVRSFSSQVSLDDEQPYAVEVFRLDPSPPRDR